MPVDYWNEASELETCSRIALNGLPGGGETDASGEGIDTALISDMIPLITTLAVVSMTIGLLSRMRWSR